MLEKHWKHVFFPLRVGEFEGFDFKKMMLVEGPIFFFCKKQWNMFGKKNGSQDTDLIVPPQEF